MDFKYHVVTWVIGSAILICTIDWWQFVKPAAILMA